uniref:HHIP-like protein 1 n=1 Tax=Myxine glutinosa TaxID=7769 RepID=UPI00358FB420
MILKHGGMMLEVWVLEAELLLLKVTRVSVYKYFRRASPGTCAYESKHVAVKGALVDFVPQESLYVEPPTEEIIHEQPEVPVLGISESQRGAGVAGLPGSLPFGYHEYQVLLAEMEESSHQESSPATQKERQKSKKKDKQRRARKRKPHEGAVRLVGAGRRKHQGKVEVYAGGKWGSVCDDLWSLPAAHVVCRQLGFPEAARALKRSTFISAVERPFLLDDVICEGRERSLLDCRHQVLGKHNCLDGENAGVECRTSDTDMTRNEG